MGDTWELVGYVWQQRTTPVAPPPRYAHRMVFDPVLGGIVMHGGTPGIPFLTDTWLWANGAWQQLAPTVAAPVPAALWGSIAYHAAIGRRVWFGGITAPSTWSQQTWTFGTPVPGAFAPFGAGCAGPGGTPVLAASAPPRIGAAASLQLSPCALLGVFVLGTSNTVAGTLPLPAPLAPIGMPGCMLLVSPDVLLSDSASAGIATQVLTIPYDPALVGLHCFVQGASLDPGANALGLVTSNALDATIGWL